MTRLTYPPSGLRSGHWTPNGLQLRDSHGKPVIERARLIARTLGIVPAARYMRARGWSVEAAAHILATCSTRS